MSSQPLRIIVPLSKWRNETEDSEGFNTRLQRNAKILDKYGELSQTEVSAAVTGKPRVLKNHAAYFLIEAKPQNHLGLR